MATNLELQKALNDLLEEAADLLDAQTKQYQDQANIIAQMVRAQGALNEAQGGDRFEQIANSLEKAATAAEEYGTREKQIRAMSKAMEESEEASGNLNKSLQNLVKTMAKVSVAEQAFKGISNGFSFVANAARGFLSVGSSLLKVMGHLGASIVAFPFRVLQNLINASDQGGSNELAQQLEEIRREFGYLNKTAGGAIVSLSKGMSGQLAQTGLSVYRVFGNLASRLKYVAEYAKNLGPIFDALNFTVGQGGAEALGAYNKALGLTAEGQKAVATRALALGRPVNEVNREIANYAIQLSDQFGVTMMSVSRDIGTMMSDFEHFGHLAPQQLAQTAVYARRLGVEVKALAGIMEKSFNFEDAANQAAQLSQAFGLNIDALQQMREQDPGRQLDNLRKAFFAAGRSVESMTRQERRLLASQTGLDAASLDAAFSLKNQALSYDQIQKKGDAAKKSQISQAEAMQRLSGAIERLVQSGGGGGGGFFDRFFKGFDVGIRRTREFRELMINLQRSLRATYQAGIQVGQAFVHAFPGVRDVLKGISGFFEPHRFRAMLQTAVTALRQFFTDLTQNPRVALPRLLDRLKEGFFNYFSRNTQSGRRLLDGLKGFFLAFTTIANGLLKTGLTSVTKGIQYIVDLLTGRARLPTPGQAGAGGFMAEAFARLVDGLGPVFRDLWKAIVQLGSALWTKVGPWFQKAVIPAIIALFGPPVIMGVARGIGTAILSSLAQAVLKGLQSRVLGRVMEQGVPAIVRQANTVAHRAAQTQSPGTGGATTEMIDQAGGASRAAQKAGQPPPSVLRTLVLLAGVVAIGIAAMLGAVLLIRAFHITPPEILTAAGMVLASVPMILAAAAVTVVAQRLPRGDVSSLAIGLAFVGGTAVAMTALGAGIVAAIRAFHFSMSDMTKAAVFIGAISTMFLAASAVVAVAAIIGSAVAATGGIGAVVVVAALGFIALVVEGMVRQGMRIMTQLDAFRPSPGFREKAAVFLDVIRAIGVFAGSIGTIMSAAAPGILGAVTSALFGNDPQVELQRTLGKVVDIISALGTQITRIISQIMVYASRMSEEQIRRGEVIGQVLGAVAGLANALAAPAGLLKDTSAWWEGSDVNAKLQSFGQNISRMGEALIRVMREVTNLMTQIGNAGATEGQMKAAQSISTILAGVGELAQNLMPRRATIEALNSSRNFAGALTNINTFARSMIDTIIGSGLLTNIGTFVNGIIRSVTNLNTSEAERAVKFAPVIAEAMRAVVATSTLVSNTIPTNVTAAPNPEAIRSLTGFMESFLTQMTGVVPNIINPLLALARGMTPAVAAQIRQVGEAVSNFLRAVGEIPTLVTGFAGEFARTEGNAMLSGVQISAMTQRLGLTTQLLREILVQLTTESFQQVFTRLGAISLPRDLRGKMETLKTTFEALARIPTAISAFQNLPAQSDSGDVASRVTSALTNVSSMVSALTQPRIGNVGNPLLQSSGDDYIGTRLGTLMIPRGLETKITQASEFIGTLITSGNSLAERFRGVATATISNSIRKMVADVNEISVELANLHPVDIPANLGRLAHNMGLGQARDFRIDRGRIQMVVNNTVTLNAGDLEYVLINRAGSSFADIRRRGE